MICMARILGAPLTVPAGKRRAHEVEGVLVGRDLSLDLRYDVHDVRVALDDHDSGTWTSRTRQTRPMSLRARSTSIRCSARSFSSASSSFSSARSSVVRGAALARAGDGADLHQAVGQAHVHLGRGADEREIARVEDEHVGRGVHGAQGAVEVERGLGERRG